MHFGGSSETHTDYMIDDLSTGMRVPLELSTCERDLGVHISSDLRWRTHVELIASKANKVLGMLVKTFTSRDSDLWKLLYTSLVRPHLEFASPVWNPYQSGDIELLERVQRRATRIPYSLRNQTYEERLKIWNLTSLETRRTRGDLIQMYKSLNGLEKIDWFPPGPRFAPPTQTRSSESNSLRLERDIFKSKAKNDFGHFVTVRHEFFLNRTSENWNRLSNSQILSPSLNSFKASIDMLPAKAAIAQ